MVNGSNDQHTNSNNFNGSVTCDFDTVTHEKGHGQLNWVQLAGRLRNMYNEKKFSAVLFLQLAFRSLEVVYGDLVTISNFFDLRILCQ